MLLPDNVRSTVGFRDPWGTMYVTRGMAAVPVQRRPFNRLPRPFLVRRRGVGADGSDANSCTSPNYWNGAKQLCCAPPGTPPGADPCSILNDPGYLAAQAADVGPVGPNGVPLSSPSFADYPGSPTRLADIANYPNNVQQDVQTCYTNPGATFVDSVGMTVNCPASKTQAAAGIYVSSYPYAQLASMLAQSITPTTNLVGNQPFAAVPSSPGEGIAQTPAAGGAVSVKIVNPSGGSNSTFNVGDAWQVIVSGPPNAQVQASASQNGTSLGSSSMGVIGSNGQLVLQGTFASSQVGQWSESWTVGGQSAGSISFSVVAPSSTYSGGITSGTSAGGGSGIDVSSLLNGSVSVAGTSVPYWALGLGAVAVFFFMGRK